MYYVSYDLNIYLNTRLLVFKVIYVTTPDHTLDGSRDTHVVPVVILKILQRKFHQNRKLGKYIRVEKTPDLNFITVGIKPMFTQKLYLGSNPIYIKNVSLFR